MAKPFFTIIIVSYNAGWDLLKSVNSVLNQTCTDYRLIVKDGGSTDDSISQLEQLLGVKANTTTARDKFCIIQNEDNGIYDAMNVATKCMREAGDEFNATDEMAAYHKGISTECYNNSFVYFLGCGDYLSNEKVLQRVHDGILRHEERLGTCIPSIYYGDIRESITGQVVPSNPKINDFACYRNVPSHQACFYDDRLIYDETFITRYSVRADYEHFLRCYYNERAQTVYMKFQVADYMGGGFSETKENRVKSENERKEIISMYLPKSKIMKYDFIRYATLAPLRTKIAENPATAKVYNNIKKAVYKLKGKK